MLHACLIDVAVAKTEKYASRESGDTVELIERPAGGITVVMLDGQGSGRAAKTLSLLLSSKAVALVKEGVRDGVVARATHDFLFAFRHGQVSATLDLLSIETRSASIVITRNAESPLLVCDDQGPRVVETASGPIGRYRWTKPAIVQLPMRVGTQLAMFTDGIPHAGRKRGLDPLDFDALAGELLGRGLGAQEIADAILARAVQKDAGLPGDDMAVVALSLAPDAAGSGPAIRRMQVAIPMT
ncbi:MAG: PP2C family protein-serine/threonine phosphatase [Thermomicrobiales bacterium]